MGQMGVFLSPTFAIFKNMSFINVILSEPVGFGSCLLGVLFQNGIYFGYSNMACWKIDHLQVIFLARNLQSSAFSCHVWWHGRVYFHQPATPFHRTPAWPVGIEGGRQQGPLRDTHEAHAEETLLLLVLERYPHGLRSTLDFGRNFLSRSNDDPWVEKNVRPRRIMDLNLSYILIEEDVTPCSCKK